MNVITILLSCLALAPVQGSTDTEEKRDSLAEAVVSAAPKDFVPLRKMSFSSTSFYAEDMQEHGIRGIKDISALAPNLFIPDYGSRLTTPIYIRGIGSRTGSSPVGIYLDGVPVSDKSSFDFDLVDIERIDVMRGPQSTLYGKNSMGGLIRIFTKDPLEYEGTDLRLGAATYGDFDASVMHYHHPVKNFAFSGGFSYSHDGGFYRNEARDGEKADRGDDFGARFRAILTASERTKFDLNVGYSLTDQGGYPYYYGDAIAYNRRSSYKRHLLNAGLNITHEVAGMTLNSVTGFQYLKDRMDMDQDFTASDIYSLMQKQNSRQVYEELTLKKSGRWSWITGITMSGQSMKTEGPVTFHSDGMAWLNGMISAQAEKYMPEISAGAMTMNFDLQDRILDEELAFGGTFSTPTVEAAIFHQSEFADLFSVRGLKATLGLRLDYEQSRLHYDAGFNFAHSYALNGNLSMPGREMVISMVPEQVYNVAARFEDKLRADNLELVPKFSLMYEHGRNNVYASVTRGFSSGGYNIQMFSELLQTETQNAVKRDIASATAPVVENTPMIPAAAKEKVLGVLASMQSTESPDIESMVRYRPEHAWNWEVGSHLSLIGGRLTADMAAYWIDTEDLQLSKMADSGLGRVTVNSGKSRSVGAEISLTAQLARNLSAHASYGYTDARFRDDRDAFVPFTPRNTASAGGIYTVYMRNRTNRISLSADWHGLGKIYWTEDNSLWQDFYGTVDSRLAFHHGDSSLAIWAANMGGSRADAFRFVSMSKEFHQKINPFQAGVELTLKF